MCFISRTKSVLVALLVGVVSFAWITSGFFTPKTPIVHTEQGPVRGFTTVSRGGRGYDAFVGFAQPPTGLLRFEPPVPAKSWNDIFEANKYAPDCYQFDAMVKGKFIGEEDCLYLNVYSPKNPDAVNLLPVMVWFHGGAFLSGGAKMYDPKYFMDEDVIIVSVNYRLGPFGFLNTGDSVVRGNMGLKDQRLALQWVKTNIMHFGGDSERVTLFGESAGAVSVHSHIISPSTKGLFKKAILQSGNLASPWSLVLNPALQAAEYSAKVGCSSKNTSEMVTCLKQQSAQQLVTPIMDFMVNAPFNKRNDMFAPSIEAVDSEDVFFKEDPRILLQKGEFNKVPVIMGVTSGEGGLRTSRLEASGTDLNIVDQKWNEYCPLLLYFDPKETEVSQKIRKYYFSDMSFSADPDAFLKNFTMMMSDGWFFQALHTVSTYHMKQAPVYLYFYDYQASSIPGVYSMLKAVNVDDWLMAEIKIAISIAKDVFKKYFGYSGSHEYGSCHGDDLFQLFKVFWAFEIGQKSNDYEFSKNLINTFVNFVTNDDDLKFNGKVWPSMDYNYNSKDTLQYMKLNSDGEVIDEPFFERLEFWESLNIRNWNEEKPY